MLPLATCGWDVGMFTGSCSGPNKNPLARPEIPGRDRIYQRPKKMPKGVSRMAEMMFPYVSHIFWYLEFQVCIEIKYDQTLTLK